LKKLTPPAHTSSPNPKHLARYVDEQVLPFNSRKMLDAERFAYVLGQVAGRRLTWEAPTAKKKT
jgi:hypothetical protein